MEELQHVAVFPVAPDSSSYANYPIPSSTLALWLFPFNYLLRLLDKVGATLQPYLSLTEPNA